MCRMQATRNSEFSRPIVPVRRSDSCNSERQLESRKSSPIALFIIDEEYTRTFGCAARKQRRSPCGTTFCTVRVRMRGDNSDNDNNNSNNSNNVFMSIPREGGDRDSLTS